jgi:hypothetical protein
MTERLNQEPHERAAMLWGVTYILMGVRYEDPVIDRLLEGVRDVLEESTTFRAILQRGREEGRVDGAREMLLRLGRQRFRSAPDAAALAAIEAIHDFQRLEILALRVNEPHVQTWGDLLELP